LAKTCSMGFRSGEYFGRKKSFGAGRAYGSANRPPLVAAEIVDDDDIARPQGWDENLLDVESELLAVDRAIEQPWGITAIVTESGQESQGLPATLRHLGPEPQAARPPPSERRHVGLGPGFIDEDQAGGLDPGLMGFPLRPPSRDVGTILLAGEHSFF
jgi:hypothetical protein